MIILYFFVQVLQKVIDELQNSMRSTADLVSGIGTYSIHAWKIIQTCLVFGM